MTVFMIFLLVRTSPPVDGLSPLLSLSLSVLPQKN